MIWERLDDDGTYYTTAEVIHALNVAERLWALLTLCIEHNFSVQIGFAGESFTDAPLGTIVPLQVNYGNIPVPLKPETLHQFAARNSNWRNEAAGVPKRFAWAGWDLVAVSPPPISPLVAAKVAREPFAMTIIQDTPGIEPEQQVHLVDFAIAFLRLKEGGQEMANAMEYMKRFLDAAEKYSRFNRSRTKGQVYDGVQPPDLSQWDRGRLDIKLKAQRVIGEAQRRQEGQDNGRVN